MNSTAGASPLATVLICTYNRARLLEDTLDSLANQSVAPGTTWEVLVVDNRSTDNTSQVVEARRPRFPVPLRYIHEPRQGKSNALNTGLAATRSNFVLFTDDDVRASAGWVEAAIAPMMSDPTIDYTGGPVHPIWDGPPPRWLGEDRAGLWGAIAILDYGPESFVFEDHNRIPIGANMAVRRSMIERVGDFNPELGRRAGSLLGQEQAEFFCRARSKGSRGRYVPAMAVHHHVPRERLSKRYFRRWWLWKGISRARLHRAHPLSETGVDTQAVRRLGGIPLFTISEMRRHASRCVTSWLRGDIGSAAEHEMMVAYYAGYAWEDWRRHAKSEKARATIRQEAQGIEAVPKP